MCTVCGCATATRIVDADAAALAMADLAHRDAHPHTHDHSHHHDHAGTAEIVDFGAGPAGLAVAGLSQERTIRIERDILAKKRCLRRRQPSAPAEGGDVRVERRLEPGFRQGRRCWSARSRT